MPFQLNPLTGKLDLVSNGLTEKDASILNLITGSMTVGNDVTINSGDPVKFDIAAGSGWVYNYDDPSNPYRKRVEWSAVVAGTIPILASQFTIPIVDEDGVISYLSGVIPDEEIFSTHIVLQPIIHVSGVQIDSIGGSSIPAFNAIQGILEYIRATGIKNTGNLFTANGANQRINKGSGLSTLPFIGRQDNHLSTATRPNDSMNLGVTNITRSFRDGLGGYSFTTGLSALDADLWDDGGTGGPATVGNNKWTIKRIHFFGQVDSTTVTLGQAEYTKKEDAILAVLSEAPDLAPNIGAGVFTTALVVKKGTTDYTDTTLAVFIPITSESIGGGTAAPVDSVNGQTGIVIINAETLPTTENSIVKILQPDGTGGVSWNDRNDNEVIDLAQSTDTALTYSGNNLTGIAYAATSLITINAKVLAYSGNTLDSVVHTFTYQSQIWTVATSFTYSANKLTGKLITIGKV